MDDLIKLATWYQVSKSKYLGPVRFRKLHEKYGDRIAEIFGLSDEELLAIPGITKQVIKGIREQKGKFHESLDFMENQLKLMEECQGGITTIDNSNYPEFLRLSSMCHPILYYKGQIDKFTDYRQSIAIVGSRKSLRKSVQIASVTARELAKDGWVIVSGLATGIDSAAHKGALEVDGLTIAVLGCGPDIVYPTKSGAIYDEVAHRGLIISEFPFGSKVEDWKLRKRNKTIVGSALAAFVVQSTAKGGAMNAAKACQEQKKKIFTICPVGFPSRFTGNKRIQNQYAGITLSPEDSATEIAKALMHA